MCFCGLAIFVFSFFIFVSTSEGKCELEEVGALISWCIYSYRILMLLVPYMWASMTFLPYKL